MLITFFSCCLNFNHKYFTGASCQKSAFKYASTDVPEMPPCNFQPEEYKVKAMFSKHAVHLLCTAGPSILLPHKLCIRNVAIVVNICYCKSISVFYLCPVDLSVQGMSKERMMEIRRQNCNPMTMKITYYKRPVFIHQGYMQWLWDVDGKRYLDLFAGVATVSVGHCHP